MTEVVGVLRGIPAPDDRWDDDAAGAHDALDGLVYRSNLLGADRALANQVGGNTSAKQTVPDHHGRDTRAHEVGDAAVGCHEAERAVGG